MQELVHGDHERLVDAALAAQAVYTASVAFPQLLSMAGRSRFEEDQSIAVEHEQVPISVCAAAGRRPFDEIRVSFRLFRNGIAELSGPSLVALPWSLAGDLEYFTIPPTILIAYFVIAAEGIAYYVERPFGQEDDHLDLNSIGAASDASVTEILER